MDRELANDCDLISRVDAMGAVQDHFNADGFKGYGDGQNMMDRIKALPPAVCDDCIWAVCNYNKVDWDAPSAEAVSREDIIGYIDRVSNSGMGRRKALEYIRKYVERTESADTDMSEYSDLLWKSAYERGKAEGLLSAEDVDYCNNCPHISWDGDFVSRAEILKYACMREGVMSVSVDSIKLAPSVTPTERTGEWVEKEGELVCSECGHSVSFSRTPKGWVLGRFCQTCGAKMKGEK